jgi:citrate lyase subunit beta / citryl-CoA lyase
VHPRSFHFIPAHRAELLPKGRASGADAVVYDLEDAVPDREKPAALEALNAWLAAAPVPRHEYVRVNGVDHALHGDELALLRAIPALGVVVPKVEAPGQMEAYEAPSGSPARSTILLIETFLGLRRLDRLVEKCRPSALGLGLEDLLSSVVFETDELSEVVTRARTDVAMCAKAYHCTAVDTASLSGGGTAAFRRECTEARSCGMDAKFTIHPAQLPVVHDVFTPSAASASRAETMISNVPDGFDVGYSKVDGVVVSPPRIRKAHAVRQFFDHYREREDGPLE